MSRTVKKLVIYGGLLIAGAALGMQLSAEDPPAANSPYAWTAVKEDPSVGGSQRQDYLRDSSGMKQPAELQGQAATPSTRESGLDTGQAAEGYQSPEQVLLEPAPPSAVDRLADKTGELLQNASRKSIDWVVSLFGSLTE